MNVALVGSNFAVRGYLPAIKKLKKIKLKIICSRNILKNNFKSKDLKNVIFDKNWRNIFSKKIDLIILAVPPKVQSKILIHNFKYKKKIIFEKPISQNLNISKNIVKNFKKKKIRSDINLTFLNHKLFLRLKNILKVKKLGDVINFKIVWSFKSYDSEKKILSWKTMEEKGGGIKNIFLTHVFSYCEFLFGKNKIINYDFETLNFKNIKYKNRIQCRLQNKSGAIGDISIFTKKKGNQYHNIKIKCRNGEIQLFTKSKDWTKDFVLKIQKNKSKKKEIFKQKDVGKFKDGRSIQIYNMIKNFIENKNISNINYCLSAEKMNATLK